MFCPNCGNQAAGDQKFCRSCGMNLQKVTPALIEHLAETGSDQSSAETPVEIRRRLRRRMLWGTAIMFIGIAYGIIGKMIIQNDKVIGAGALVTIIGMFWLVYQLLSASFGPATSTRDLSQMGKALDAKTTDQLMPESAQVIMPSVAERTTDLLVNAPGRSVECKNSGELRV